MSGPVPGRRGFSLPELLVVLAILGLAVMVAVPLVSHQLRSATIRAAAGQFAADLKAIRMIAVSHRRTVNVPWVTVTVALHPDNYYSYTDVRGQLHRIDMPGGIRIVSSTPNLTIQFEPNGSVRGGNTTIFEAGFSTDLLERWTVTTSELGVPRTDYVRIEG